MEILEEVYDDIERLLRNADVRVSYNTDKFNDTITTYEVGLYTYPGFGSMPYTTNMICSYFIERYNLKLPPEQIHIDWWRYAIFVFYNNKEATDFMVEIKLKLTRNL